MTIKFNCTGSERKRLVEAIVLATVAKPKYLGAPSFAYEVDYFTIDKNGTLTFDDSADSEEIESLLESLSKQGFTAESDAPETTGLCISLPSEQFTEDTFTNLGNLLTAKGDLIKKALCVTDLTVVRNGDKVDFPWFAQMGSPEEVNAYARFIGKLVGLASTQKRVNAKERDVDNEKYAFRCFLLRLGFIGNEYKAERKILLRSLSGSSAFKNGQPTETEVALCEQ